MTLPVMPNPKIQFFDNSGNPLAGGKIYSYEAGTSTPKATYSEATGTTANANPTILDSRGEAAIYLSGTYKIVLKDADDVQLWSIDNVSAMPYTTVTQSEWVDQNLTLTYSSATVFTIPSDLTASFVVGRRIKAVVSAGTIYGVIKTSAYTTLTTVTCVWDSGSLDSGLSDVSLGLIMPTNTAYPNLYALPRYTTTQRDALTAAAGMVIYNTTTTKIEAYHDSAWNTVHAGATPTISDFTNMAHDHGDANDGGAIVWQGLPDGVSIQTVKTQTGAVATGTTVMPVDDTIPQNTEGDEYMTLAITPKATTNILIIDISCSFTSNTGSTQVSGALFQDTTVNALAANACLYQAAASDINNTFFLRHTMAAGTTSATTFKFRAGPAGAATITMNGTGGARLFGGVMASSITITEYKAS